MTYRVEAHGSSVLNGVGLTGGDMESNETRFGLVASALFAVVTTAASCDAVNAMRDSFRALKGLISLIDMQLGEVIIGSPCLPLMMLGFTALATVLPAGLAGPANAGPHGFSEILDAYTSAAANNGSAFGGLIFFPSLALEPVVEHLVGAAGQTFGTGG